jgi:uncharacterized protein
MVSTRFTAAAFLVAGLMALPAMTIPLRADTAAGYAAYQEQNYAVAFAEWLKAAEEGDAVAQFNLSILYDDGLGTEKDPAKAAVWLIKAAEQGYADAQFNLGNNYKAGKSGIPVDLEKAIYWLTKAGEQGDAKAQYNLGLIYENTVEARDYTKAALWYGKAAEQDHAGGQANLAVLYHNGQGVPQDYARALDLNTKADAKDSPVAARNLGNMFETGTGVAQSNAEAIRYYRRAAFLGDYRAKMILAFRYRDGKIVAEDFVLAHVYAGLALDDPTREAVDGPETNLFRRELELRMADDQIAESEKLLTDFLQTGSVPTKSATWKN